MSYYQKKGISIDIEVPSSAGTVHPWPIFLGLLTLLITFLVGFPFIKAENFKVGVPILTVGILISIMWFTCLKVADQWHRVVILRLGKFLTVRLPGVFFLWPFIDTIASWIDVRIRATDLIAEQALTRDTVPVDVDAIMFWFVFDPKKAALEVEKYTAAVSWAAQTALRDLIGKTDLADLLVGREKIDRELQVLIDSRTTPWGITVNSVEIRDIKIPAALQDAMSRQAQAERERQARIILGESEMQIADKFAKAAEVYATNPHAMHLRAMNMLFEGLKEKGSLIIVPSSAVDTMNLGGLLGTAAIAGMHTGPLQPPTPPSGAEKPEAPPPSV